MADEPINDAPKKDATVSAEPPVRPPATVPIQRRETKEEKKALKKEKKKIRRQKDAHRRLDSWERYRVLRDTLDDGNDLVDLADHKARFAMVLMGTINAVLFIVGTRAEIVSVIPFELRTWLGLGVVLYALIAVYFFIQAIEALRPRRFNPQVPMTTDSSVDRPMGLRFFADIIKRNPPAYATAWQDVRMGQLNAEVAMQAYSLARINDAKYSALHRLYLGLKAMTLMGTVFLGAVVYFALYSSARKAPNAHAASSQTADIALPRAHRIPVVGISEPSGIVYHGALQHLFVASDDGHLAELDEEGRLLSSDPVRGNIEDLAVHTPSGKLLLLAEKQSELILFDPTEHAEVRRWRFPRAEWLGQEPGDVNFGFEGLAFKPDETRPGRGVFYLVHQRQPVMMVAIAFDPARPSGSLGQDCLIGRFIVKAKSLSAITYIPAIERFLAIDPSEKIGLILSLNGETEWTLPIVGKRPEGVCFDDRGRLWIADDLERLLYRFDDVMPALLKRYLPEPSPTAMTTDTRVF
jgi:uncharacterized protein YjiK